MHFIRGVNFRSRSTPNGSFSPDAEDSQRKNAMRTERLSVPASFVLGSSTVLCLYCRVRSLIQSTFIRIYFETITAREEVCDKISSFWDKNIHMVSALSCFDSKARPSNLARNKESPSFMAESRG
jgi:hypothetical protein